MKEPRNEVESLPPCNYNLNINFTLRLKLNILSCRKNLLLNRNLIKISIRCGRLIYNLYKYNMYGFECNLGKKTCMHEWVFQRRSKSHWKTHECMFSQIARETILIPLLIIYNTWKNYAEANSWSLACIKHMQNIFWHRIWIKLRWIDNQNQEIKVKPIRIENYFYVYYNLKTWY
jgi:hypothetical protein